MLTPDDENIFIKVSGYWTRFAERGNPNIDDVNVAQWPRFKHPTGRGEGADRSLLIDSTVQEGKRLRGEHCAFWESYFFRSITAAVPAHTP